MRKFTKKRGAARRVENAFHDISEDAAELMAKRFRHQIDTMSKGDWAEIVGVAATTLDRNAMRLMLETRLQPDAFRNALVRQRSHLHAQLTDAQRKLHRELLDTAASAVFSMAGKLDNFDRDSVKYLFEESEQIRSALNEGIKHLETIFASSSYGAVRATDRYRRRVDDVAQSRPVLYPLARFSEGNALVWGVSNHAT